MISCNIIEPIMLQISSNLSVPWRNIALSPNLTLTRNVLCHIMYVSKKDV